ncbi:addiction module toxin, RelE/StbE family [Methanolacinia petrolearia DSM 11571]|uniref:Addiction module toxin, RelE/StbE family n=1 Tax=Methanolacinia petrolearia (strain DSM 11571 / OCM 486 / SEBR 4847) TaxID=679926 RepID=E1RD89_METP4|nr:type II toxin-antitoxin system RelE/ParE family toxin [Methanolacinia petrolearia]ADN37072.1 addiction module toxin, RelE/StbE family [Methanolacinia petrolearia DSM 11571]
MVESDFSDTATKFLKRNKAVNKVIMAKIKKCLEDHLFDTIRSCNKHELKGEFKGFWRLHVTDYVVIYKIAGIRPYRHAFIYKIMTEKAYHNWIKY